MSRIQAIRITDIHNDEIRAEAYKKDVNQDGLLQRSEDPKLFDRAMPVGTTGGNAAYAGGLTVAFATALPGVLDASVKFAGLGALWGGVFQAIGSGGRNIEAMRKGTMTGAEAAIDTVKDTAIASASGAGGAALGGVVAGVVATAAGMPLVGWVVGIMIAAGAAFVADRAAHSLFNGRLKQDSGASTQASPQAAPTPASTQTASTKSPDKA